MPSSRTSPVMSTHSPLAQRYDPTSRFEPTRPPSPRNISTRSGTSQRRTNSNTLKLPTLPRFHPSNYPSAQTSPQRTPEAGSISPQAPSSPRQHQRVISDAQKHLFAYQRETISAAARSSTPAQLDNPASPHLMPIGSPGPVTPLQLESEDGGYLAAGMRGAPSQPVRPDDLMERLMREEAARQWRNPYMQMDR